MRIVKYSAPILFCLLLSCSGQQQTNSIYQEEGLITLQGSIFGTTYSIKYPIGKGAERPEKIQQKVMTRLEEIDNLMSTWKEDSQLSRFNRLPPHQTMEVDQELIAMLVLSSMMNRISEGAFDITVGPLVNLWGFGPQGRADEAKQAIPTKEELEAARANTGTSHLLIGRDSLNKKTSLYLDLSAIAKGYAVDEAGRVLQQLEINNYLVEIGGELFARGRKPNGDKWQIAIEEPTGKALSVHKTIGLENLGMATSGDYRNYYEKGGVRYSHTIDPRTMKPVFHQLASATVVHRSTAMADAFATALMVMGTKKALNFAKKHNLAVYLIKREEEGFSNHFSAAFMRLERQP